MCFSAPAGFAVGAVLLPLGVYKVNHALHHDRRYVALAAFPLLFGVQQAVEGGPWRALDGGGGTGDVSLLALGFLFFAYLL